MNLTKTNPTTGRPNPYRTRWAVIDDVQFVASSDSLYGLWTVGIDTDALFHRLNQSVLVGRAKQEVADKILALVTDVSAGESVYGMSCRIAYRLYGKGRTRGQNDVVSAITEVVEGENWDAIRDAWLHVADMVDAANRAAAEQSAAWGSLAGSVMAR